MKAMRFTEGAIFRSGAVGRARSVERAMRSKTIRRWVEMGVLGDARLMVKPSKIPGAGLGLFTRTCIRKGEQICEYTGSMLTVDELNQKPDSETQYVLGLSTNVFIDAGNRSGINAEFLELPENRAVILATRDIPPEEEVYVNYGEWYWKKRGIPPGGFGDGGFTESPGRTWSRGLRAVVYIAPVLCFITMYVDVTKIFKLPSWPRKH
ncbi:hypothetical protein AAMO2058_000248100 [Amorphochlora amoebiformis]